MLSPYSEYFKDPPAVTFKPHEKLITVHDRKIAVNALKDEAKARKIIQCLKNEINTAWEHKKTIPPVTQVSQNPAFLRF